jgi:methylated-DNA-[protein]-cysteine S-methyltransferase
MIQGNLHFNTKGPGGLFRPFDFPSVDGVRFSMAGELVFFDLTDSPFGRVGLAWTDRDGVFKVLRVFLPTQDTPMADHIRRSLPGSKRQSSEASGLILEGIRRMLRGRVLEYNLSVLNLEACTDFQRRVLLEDRKIPRGKASTYGKIAGRVGQPKGARAVGSALATNPFPLLIPCHRVVRSNGELGGFQSGTQMKKALLEMEGVRFDPAGRVEPSFLW